jgi:AraC-like DNA-binding protein
MGYSGSVPFIYASIITPVPDLIADLGGKVDRPFRQSGVPVELAAEPERIISMRNYFALLEAAARETGDEHFGVSMAEHFEVDDLGAFGRLLTGAPTLRRAIETCNGLVQSYSPAMSCRLESDGERVRWQYQLAGVRDSLEGRRLDCENTLYLFRTLIRLAAGPNWQPDEIVVGQATPHQLRVFEARLGAPVRRLDGNWALVFPRDLLGLPMTYAKPLGETEQQALHTRLKSTAPDDCFAGAVKAIVRSQLCGGYPEISAAARSTGLSVRTLQRRLADESLVYSDLVTDVRRDLALEMLSDPSQRQLDVAMSLGYADAANFTRAFRHWTGVTPREFRRALERAPAAV